jgi:hypothetical protein
LDIPASAQERRLPNFGQHGAARKHDCFPPINIDELEKRIKEAAKIRNAICHGSWRIPDETGKSALFYYTENKWESFDNLVDVNFLKQVQYGTAEIIYDVMSSITLMGFQFPGSSGPGKSIY